MINLGKAKKIKNRYTIVVGKKIGETLRAYCKKDDLRVGKVVELLIEEFLLTRGIKAPFSQDEKESSGLQPVPASAYKDSE